MTHVTRTLRHARKARALNRQWLYGSALGELTKAWRCLDKASEVASDRILLRLVRCLRVVGAEVETTIVKVKENCERIPRCP